MEADGKLFEAVMEDVSVGKGSRDLLQKGGLLANGLDQRDLDLWPGDGDGSAGETGS
jgi:hypothetical protein